MEWFIGVCCGWIAAFMLASLLSGNERDEMISDVCVAIEGKANGRDCYVTEGGKVKKLDFDQMVARIEDK